METALRSVDDPAHPLRSLVPAALRGKAPQHRPRVADLPKAGFRPGRAFLFITVALELIAGFGLVVGVFEQVAAGLAVIVLLGASYAVIKINGLNWRWQKQGPEFMLFWACACVLSVIDSEFGILLGIRTVAGTEMSRGRPRLVRLVRAPGVHRGRDAGRSLT